MVRSIRPWLSGNPFEEQCHSFGGVEDFLPRFRLILELKEDRLDKQVVKDRHKHGIPRLAFRVNMRSFDGIHIMLQPGAMSSSISKVTGDLLSLKP